MANQHTTYNTKNPAIKRLLREYSEFQKDPSSQFMAAPLDDNLFEWHFTIRGQKGSDFDGGIYHGRIILPPEYPFKPPNISFLTPNGRFSVGTKICLSISAYHPEEWQPSWSIRTVLVALIGFMPTKGEGAIGALDYAPEDRKVLATQSLDWKCSTCGFHAGLLPPDNPEDASAVAENQPQLFFSTKPDANAQATSPDSNSTTTPTTSTTPTTPTTPTPTASTATATASTDTPTPATADATPTPREPTTQTTEVPRSPSPEEPPKPRPEPSPAVPLPTLKPTTVQNTPLPQAARATSTPPSTDALTWFIYAVAALFFAILFRRFFSSAAVH